MRMRERTKSMKSKKEFAFEKRERTKFMKAYRMRIDFKFDKFYVRS
jgi:hypothetical protein